MNQKHVIYLLDIYKNNYSISDTEQQNYRESGSSLQKFKIIQCTPLSVLRSKCHTLFITWFEEN